MVQAKYAFLQKYCGTKDTPRIALLSLDYDIIIYRSHITWHSARHVYLNPYPLSQQVCLILISEGLLEGEEGAFVAVVVYPAADNVDLIDLRLAYNTGRVTQFSGHCQQFADGQFHRIWLVRDRALLQQAAMANEEKLVTTFLRRGIDNKQVVGFDCSSNQALTDQYLVSAAYSVPQPGGTLEVELLRSLQHLPAQTVQQVFTLPA